MHVLVVVGVVGDDFATESPFIEEDAFEQGGTATCPHRADAVIRGHHRVSQGLVLLIGDFFVFAGTLAKSFTLNADTEGFEIDFA